MQVEYFSEKQKLALLELATVYGNFTLASGNIATQKFDFDLIKDRSRLFKRVVKGLAQIIADNCSDQYTSITTVAEGATRLGKPVARQLKVPHIPTRYDYDETGSKVFSLATMYGEAGSTLIVDDVFTRGTNTTKVAHAARAAGVDVCAVVVVLDRSLESNPTILHGAVPVFSLIKHELQ